jgi:hypothetical protein
MQVVELSNHPSDMLHDVSLRRRSADQRARDLYEDALIRGQRAEIARLIRRDHDFHERTRRPRTPHR